MMDKINRLRRTGQHVNGRYCSVKYITLTAQKMIGPKQFKAHMRALFERIRRAHPGASAIWKIEPQERGACHAHLLVFGMPYVKQADLHEAWTEIIGGQGTFHIKALNGGKKQILYYVSKYVAKVVPPSLVEGTKPHAEGDGWENPGRWWGVHNADALPYAPLIQMSQLPTRAYYMFRRSAARKSRHVLRGGRGFILFVDDIAQWMKLLQLYHHQWPEKPWVPLNEKERRTWGECYNRQSTVKAPMPTPPHPNGSGGVGAWIARMQN